MILYTLLTLISSLLTFNLIKLPSITPTRASAGVSLVLILSLTLLNNFYSINLEALSTVTFGASFVGMCSHKSFSDLHIIVASIIFICFYKIITPYFIHLGGALGFSAFLSICTSYIIFKYSPFTLVKKKLA
ncbi:MAG: hypothetical protein ACRBBP_01600 [Bdellovibrionales bacterium]